MHWWKASSAMQTTVGRRIGEAGENVSDDNVRGEISWRRGREEGRSNKRVGTQMRGQEETMKTSHNTRLRIEGRRGATQIYCSCGGKGRR